MRVRKGVKRYFQLFEGGRRLRGELLQLNLRPGFTSLTGSYQVSSMWLDYFLLGFEFLEFWSSSHSNTNFEGRHRGIIITIAY